MVGDIISLADKAFEIREIHKNAVEGKFLSIPLGIYTEAWTRVKPFYLTAGVLRTIGFEKVEESKENLWCYKGSSFKVHYNLGDNSLSILGEPVKVMGFTFCYITTLHELIHKFNDFNIDTVHIYRNMRMYNARSEKSESQ